MSAAKLMLFVSALWSGLLPLLFGPQILLGAVNGLAHPVVYLLDVDGTINPAVADFIESGLDKAEEKHAAALVIRMDTPGGVLMTTKTVIKRMSNATVPVVVLVGSERFFSGFSRRPHNRGGGCGRNSSGH